MRRTYKINRKTKKGGMNKENNKTKSNNKTKNNKRNNITLRPTISHPNNLQRLGPPGVKEMRKRLEFLRPTTSLSTSNNSFFTNAKPGLRVGVKYPPLPETPTNRVGVLTNNESLVPPKRESNEYKKRHNRLMKTFSEARQRTLMNRFFGIKRPEPKLNSEGNPKSFFTVNNKVGFKP